MQKVLATSVAALMIATQVLAPAAVHAEHDSSTATPIKHLVVIFGENVSFDHYFGTYPNALNPRTSRGSSRRRTRQRSMAIRTRCSTTIPTC